MKTTLELPDELLIAAKQVAAQRRTTLKEMVTHSLRREIGLDAIEEPTSDSPYEIGEMGLPVLKKRGMKIDDKTIQNISAAIEDEDLEDALKTRGS